jgi:hypothetical protein
MSAAMYDDAVVMFARGELDWERDTVKVVLVDPEYVPSQSSDSSRAALRGHEVSTAARLDGREVSRGALSGDVRLLGGTVGWTGFTGRFRYAVLFQANGDAASDRLVSYTDLGLQEATNARVSLEYDRDDGVAVFSILSTQE